MNWAPFIIPLIVLIVWILSNLARQEEPPRRGNRPRRPIPGGNPQQRPRPQRSADDVDRFLANLRKQRQAEQTPPPPRPQPQRKPTPIPPPVPQQATPKRTPKPPKEKVIPVLVAEPEPDPITVDFTKPATEKQIVLPIAPILPAPQARAKSRNRSAAAEKLFKMQLLRDPEMLQAAFLMREIFGRPAAYRQGQAPSERR